METTEIHKVILDLHQVVGQNYWLHRKTFQMLLDKDHSLTIHHKNLQALAIEIFKQKQNLGAEILSEIFYFQQSNYNLRNPREICQSIPKTVHYGTETVSHLGPIIWSMIPSTIKDSNSIAQFKLQIKSWKPSVCPCRLCRTYIQGVGFIS